jgi:RNA polymerase sigma-70 factor (ECF subfamily)
MATEAFIIPEQRAIQEALLKLKDDVRELLVLHYYEGLDLKEISGVLDIPVGTVKSRLFTAKGLLREELLNKGFDV